MSQLIRATAITNSLDDACHRIRVSSEQFWTESPLLPVIDGVSVNKNDTVLVDISGGVQNAYVFGKIKDADYSTQSQMDGVVIFESHDAASWLVCTVSGSTLEIRNSAGAVMQFSGNTIIFNGGNLGGIPIASALVNKLNKLNSSVNSLKNCFNAWSPKGNVSDAVELKAIVTAWESSQIPTVENSDIEDIKIKH